MKSEVAIDDTSCRRLTAALDFLGRRWNGAILLALARGADRFSAVLHDVPGLSDRMLAARLKELVEHGCVERTVVPSTPVQIRYHLTNYGEKLLLALQPLLHVGKLIDGPKPPHLGSQGNF